MFYHPSLLLLIHLDLVVFIYLLSIFYIVRNVCILRSSIWIYQLLPSVYVIMSGYWLSVRPFRITQLECICFSIFTHFIFLCAGFNYFIIFDRRNSPSITLFKTLNETASVTFPEFNDGISPVSSNCNTFFSSFGFVAVFLLRNQLK